jgi:SWI/SNF-related matrix-associated actin-dependent regulator of chromatin subfamily A-like protein 1
MPISELNPTKSSLLETAIKALASVNQDWASVRNDIGYNKMDSGLGNKLATIPEEKWTPRQRMAAYYLLRKYRNQLMTVFGINYDEIERPETPIVVKVPPIGSIILDKTNINISFAYDAKIVEEIKNTFSRRRWVPETKHWEITAVPQIEKELRNFFKFLDTLQPKKFEIDPAVYSLMERIHSQEQIFEDLSGADKLTEKLVIPGLAKELYPFQEVAVKYAIEAKRVLICDDVGCGKTIESIATVQYLNAYPVLVISTANMKLNWAKEYKTWLPEIEATVINSQNALVWTKDMRLTDDEKLPDPLIEDPKEAIKKYPVVIINYDILKNFVDKVMHNGSLVEREWAAIICDEFHYLKEHKAQRTKNTKEIIMPYDKQKRLRVRNSIPINIFLSGTPFVNRPKEGLQPLYLIKQLQALGGFWHYIRYYCQQDPDTKHYKHLVELNQRLRSTCMVRREKEEVLMDLPDLRRVVIPVEIDNRKEYELARHQLYEWIKQKVANDKEFLEEISGLPLDEQKKAIHDRQMNKVMSASRAHTLVMIEALKQAAAKGVLTSAKEWVGNFLESGKKLVVFAYHKEIQDALIDAFPGCLHILGGETSIRVEETKHRFQTDPTIQLMVNSLLAGSEGHTLTAASDLLTVEFGWTPKNHEQAEGRLHRLTQKNAVTSWYLMANHTIYEWLAAFLNVKTEIIKAVTEGKEVDEDGYKIKFIQEIENYILHQGY